MMFKVTDENRRKDIIKHIIIAALLYAAVSLPFRYYFSFFNGATDLRPANCLSPVLGLIWGWPAALGIGIGNFISDLLMGESLEPAMIGSLITALGTYFSYKLWYSVAVDQDDAAPSLGSVRQIFKFMVLQLVLAPWFAFSLATLIEFSGLSPASDTYLILYYNNFDFSLFLGVPILMILGKKRIKYVMPRIEKCSVRKSVLFDGFLILSFLCGLIWTTISVSGVIVPVREVSRIFLIFIFLFALPMLVKPYNFEGRPQRVRPEEVVWPIRYKAMIPLFLAATGYALLIGFTTYNAYAGEPYITIWREVTHAVGRSMSILFFVVLALLWYIEKIMVKPLEKLTDHVADFSKEMASGEDIPRVIPTDIINKDELGLLAKTCTEMMQSISNYAENLQKITSEREHLKAELDIAAAIQQSALPNQFPAFPKLDCIDLYATMKPAKEVGGDFYDFFMVDEDHLAIIMADVSGKGIPAAMFMMVGKTLIKIQARMGYAPGEVFTLVNNQLCESNKEEFFITAYLGILNLRTGEYQYANAGHEMPFIEKKTEPFTPKKIRAGFVLAGMENIQYKTFTEIMMPGDKIFQYTDGVTEATDGENRLFGMERLEKVLRASYNSSPRVILERVDNAINTFVGDAPQFDDLTMLCLEYKMNKE